MRRMCSICESIWDASIKSDENHYICPDCEDKNINLEIRYPIPSRKFRHNKKSRSAGRLYERLIIQSI